jgi:hypothetical protein
MNGVTLPRGGECFLDTLAAVLSQDGLPGDDLVDAASRLAAGRPGSGKIPLVAYEGDVLTDRIGRWTGGVIRREVLPDWKAYRRSVSGDVREGRPVLVSVDAFFLAPKKLAHETHFVAVNSWDEKTDGIGFQSTALGAVLLHASQFRLAAAANGGEFRRPYLRFHIRAPTKSPDRIRSEIIAHLAGGEASRLGPFVSCVTEWVSGPLESVDRGLGAIFEGLKPVVQQRRRTREFVSRFFGASSAVARRYASLHREWDVFRNMAFKAKQETDAPTKRDILVRLRARLDAIVSEEDQAARALAHAAGAGVTAETERRDAGRTR